MAVNLSNSLVKEFAELNKSNDAPKETTAYGTVYKDSSGIYVTLDGSSVQTPASTVMDVSTGDRVTVVIKNHSAIITGNITKPADQSKAIAQEALDNVAVARQAATEANSHAQTAATAAETASTAASTASTAAQSARADATQAASDAAAASTAASNAGASASTAADAAQSASNSASQAATEAGNSRQSAQQAASNAATAAQNALDATNYANSALSGLSTIENVIGVLNWFAEHATLTTDIVVDPNKKYYAQAQDGSISIVNNPEGNPATQGWYEVDEAVTNYILAHVALSPDGLYVLVDPNGYKVKISDRSVSILNEEGVPVAEYGDTITIGISGRNQVSISDRSVAFSEGGETIGYISEDKGYFLNQEIGDALYLKHYSIREDKSEKLVIGRR